MSALRPWGKVSRSKSNDGRSDGNGSASDGGAIGGGLGRDLPSIGLLLVLYTLQGVPMGLSGSIPFLLHGRVSYAQQSFFSLASLPFSLKLLWAPLVDSIYHRPFGRRKSWLVPVQMLCGILMLGGAGSVEAWVSGTGSGGTGTGGTGGGSIGEPCVGSLVAFFLALYLLMATQDIAVDGWALTMLSRRNVGYASTCNTVGQTLGFFVAHVGFLALNDPSICNRYLRNEPVEGVGLVTLGSFMFFWGAVFVATTLFVCFGKRETEDDSDEEVDGPLQTYRQLLQCLRLPTVQSLCLVLLTCKAAFAVTDAATSLKLVEYGMPKEELALLSPLLVFMGMAVPVGLGRLTAGPRPLSIFLFGYPLRIAVTLAYALVLPLARRAYSRTAMVSAAAAVAASAASGGDVEPDFYLGGGGSMDGRDLLGASGGAAGDDASFGDGGEAWWSWLGGRGGFYLALVLAVGMHEVASNCMYVSQMAFFARVSDPVIGGTYMTLLNTVANLGTKWPGTLSLWAMDAVTWKSCIGADFDDTADGAAAIVMAGAAGDGGGAAAGASSLGAGSAAAGGLSVAAWAWGWLPSFIFGRGVGGGGGWTPCDTSADTETCLEAGGACEVVLDGYNVQAALCVAVGIAWLAIFRGRVLRLQEASLLAWHTVQLEAPGGAKEY